MDDQAGVRLLSDFGPIAGYRRKSYCLIMTSWRTAAFAVATGVRDPGQMLI